MSCLSPEKPRTLNSWMYVVILNVFKGSISQGDSEN